MSKLPTTKVKSTVNVPKNSGLIPNYHDLKISNDENLLYKEYPYAKVYPAVRLLITAKSHNHTTKRDEYKWSDTEIEGFL